ncbi:hypothetical protein [Acidiferrobacter sp.]|jgi:hypothetical protein|uniref:hypothetical protein n=1 Tax=Acidiferrobacter sp. TaxID=1872107 RepID=UPI002613F5A8|nr:hypothetical protein [Acidiferrobacter sp.]
MRLSQTLELARVYEVAHIATVTLFLVMGGLALVLLAVRFASPGWPLALSLAGVLAATLLL